MKSYNYSIKLLFILITFFCTKQLNGQCPNTIYLSYDGLLGSCLKITWNSPPSTLPSEVLYVGVALGAGIYTYSSGNGSALNPAIYKNNLLGPCNNSGYVPFIGIITFTLNSTFYNCTYINGILPLNLINFTSEKYNNDILVKWSCTDSDQCIGYELEKSYDGTNWSVLTFKSNDIPNQQINYSYIDNQISTNTIYYRIKQINKDNKYDYSKTISYLDNNDHRYIINPNPAIDEIKLVANHQENIEHLQCYDITGKALKIRINELNVIDISDLPSGLYYLNIETNKNFYIQKFIKADSY